MNNSINKMKKQLFSTLLGSALFLSTALAGLSGFALLNPVNVNAALNCPAGSTEVSGQCIETTAKVTGCPVGFTLAGTTCTSNTRTNQYLHQFACKSYGTQGDVTNTVIVVNNLASISPDCRMNFDGSLATPIAGGTTNQYTKPSGTIIRICNGSYNAVCTELVNGSQKPVINLNTAPNLYTYIGATGLIVTNAIDPTTGVNDLNQQAPLTAVNSSTVQVAKKLLIYKSCYTTVSTNINTVGTSGTVARVMADPVLVANDVAFNPQSTRNCPTENGYPTSVETADISFSTQAATNTCPAGFVDAGPTTCSKVVAATSLIVDNGAYIGTGDCTATTVVTAGDLFTCKFPLTGSPNGVYTLPAKDPSAAAASYAALIAQVTYPDTTNPLGFGTMGGTGPCTISGAVLTCTMIGTDPARTPGLYNVGIQRPYIGWLSDNKGKVTLTAPVVDAAATLITISNIDAANSSCAKSTLTIPEKANCTFDLTGSTTNNYTAGAGHRGYITTVTGIGSDDGAFGDVCTVINNKTATAALFCPNIPTATGTVGAQFASIFQGTANTVPVTLVAPVATVVTAANTGNGVCDPAEVIIGNYSKCTFPLTGGIGNKYTLPQSGIRAKATTVPGSSSACTITGDGTATATLVCTNVPTAGGTAGLQKVSPLLTGETSTADLTLKVPVFTFGTAPTGTLSGTVGGPISGMIITTNGTYNGVATVKVNDNCVIPGTFSLGKFTPSLSYVIQAGCPTGDLSVGTLMAAGIADLKSVKTNFMAKAVVVAPTTPTTTPTKATTPVTTLPKTGADMMMLFGAAALLVLGVTPIVLKKVRK
jgi:LPXTG-motif cell wall-anchored protein